MKKTKTGRATKAFADAVAIRPTGKYVLRLHVVGATNRSRQAILRTRKLREAELEGDFVPDVIDVCQQPILARDGQIIAIPTLIREFPRPVRRFFGSLTNTTGMFVGLNLETKGRRTP